MTQLTDLPRKERERLRRREDILAAAKKVFAEKGFAGSTLDEIAIVAEYGKGTIYNYFSSKEELFITLIREGLKAFKETVNAALAPCETVVDKLEKYIEVALNYFYEHQNAFKIISFEIHQPNSLSGVIQDELRETYSRELYFISQLIEQGVSEGRFRITDAQRLARVLQGMIHSQICQVGCPDAEERSVAIETVKSIFLYGCLLPEQKTGASGTP